MEIRKIHKVPGGKLLKVAAEMVGDVLGSVSITGDFFIHPEDSIDDLERSLEGLHAASPEARAAIDAYFGRDDVEVYGFGPDDLAGVIAGMREKEG